MKIALIGGGGCFALNFARYCDREGIEVLGIGRTGPKHAPFWLAPPGFLFWQLHLVTQLPAILSVLDTVRPAVIVQFAAQGEGAASFGENAPDFFQTNTVALSQLVVALRKRDYLRRFVQIGSSEVYGSPEKPSHESDCLKPTSPYSVSKAAFDQYLESVHRTSLFPMNIIRPSNCYTEGQQLYRVIPKTILCALKGEKLKLHGGGRAVKSYLHADDLSRAILDVIELGTVGSIYNVGPDEPISIRDLVSNIADACGVSFDSLVEEAPDRTGQDARYHLDSGAIKALGWKQRIGLDEGLPRMVDWVKRFPELLTMDTTYRHRA